MEALILLLWPVFAILVGVFAHRRGRLGFPWFMLALIFSPLLIWIVLLAIGPAPDFVGVVGTPSAATHVRCPDCRELVLRDARKCKHCGTALVPQ